MTPNTLLALPREDAAAIAELLRTLETVLDEHFGYPGAADILFTAAGMHAETLTALLADTTPTTGTAP